MFFTFSSLLILAVSLLLVVAMFAAKRGSGRDERHDWFKWHLGASLVFILTVLLDDVVYGMEPRLFYWLEYPAVLLAAITYGELGYAVAGLTRTRQQRLYRWIVLACSAVWAFGFYRAVATGEGFATLLILPILLFSWPAVVLAARLKEEGVGLFQVKALWQGIADVTDRDRAMLGFFLMTLLRILGSAAPVLTLQDGVPAEIVYGAFFVNSLIIVAGMVAVYLLYIEKRADLAYKITSFLSVFLISTFVIVVLAFYEENQPFRARDVVFLERNDIHISVTDDNMVVRPESDPAPQDIPSFTRLVAGEGGAYRVALPFPFRIGGKEFREMFALENGQLVAVQAGAAPPVQTTPFQRRCYKDSTVIYVLCLPGAELAVFQAQAEDSILIRWSDGKAEAGEAAFEVRLQVDNNMMFRYGTFPKVWSERREALIGVYDSSDTATTELAFTDMPLVADRAGFAFDLAYGRRALIHERLQPVVVFLIAAVITILFVFRAYIKYLIVRPLEVINTGLAKIDGGSLDERLVITGKDEFSDIADGFNHMAESLDEARQRVDEQTELMEREIAFRTVEAAKKIDTTLLSKDQQFENRLRDVIESNIGDFDFQVAELADAMAVSTRQLHRRVVDLTAQTPASLIRMLRLDHAYQLLSARAANVSEAAYRSGFRDVSYFSKLFQKKFNIQPSELVSQA